DSTLDKVNLTKAMVYDVDVTGASMMALIIDEAQIFHTGISIGGELVE
ncbi:MAG: pentapeptide repeat-containing protein, partial [Crocosphaera sp.]